MPDFSHEDAARALGFRRIAGVDEVGRGPWAGPVVAAAALLDATTLPDSVRQQLDDSKKLSASRRQAVLQALTASPGVVLAVAEASVAEIDASNILAAALLAMTRAVAGLPEAPDFVLVDGNHLPPALPCAAEAVIGGDGRSLSIAAASIAAKVHRDRLMAELAKRYPGYGWERNAGYGTQQHQQALASLGVTPEHRRSFRPVAKILR